MALSERMESIEHVLQYALVGELGDRQRSAYNDQAMVEQVAQENPDDPDGQVKLGGHLGHRERGSADLDDGAELRSEHRCVGWEHVRGLDNGDEVEITASVPSPPPGHRVWAYDGACGLVHPLVLRRCHAHSPVRGLAERCCPTRATSMAISYAMWPTSASASAITQRQAPEPAAVTNRNADSISTMVCRTAPPPDCRPAPRARLRKPDATAATCSASSLV